MAIQNSWPLTTKQVTQKTKSTKHLGNKKGPYFDIAVDPVEGTNFVANNLPGAISVLAISEKGNLFKAPETYMEKIATSKIDKDLIDLDFSLEKNIKKFFVRYMELKGYAMLHIFFFRMGNYFLFYQSPCCFYDLRDHSIVSLMI